MMMRSADMDALRPLLKLQGVAKAFGPRLLFRHVHAEILPGTLSLLVGANGAGKSTLMKLMAGLSKPDAGTIECAVSQEQIGYMAHATFLYPGLNAYENLLFWAKAMKLPQPYQCVKTCLDMVGLTRHAKEQAGIFSRGMAQRLNLARLMLANPRLILLDEPATGLDTASRQILHDLMLHARSHGAAIIWISHMMDEDSRIADCILTLQNHTLTVSTGDASC
jgi:heme exporter protein A